MKYQKKDLAYFPYQIEYALSNYRPHSLEKGDFQNILVGGLGGSGIAAHLVKAYLFGQSEMPLEVISDYSLPAYVNAQTLVILNSYSGNTEETLNMYQEAREKNARVMVITTGGKLLERANQHHHHYYLAEEGFQPRMALGYPLTYLLLILGDLLEIPVKNDLLALTNYFRDTEYFIQEGKQVFEQFKAESGKKLISITDRFTYPAGLRFCQQVQENAKGEAFVHELPEANHNVIESYYGKLNSVFLLLNGHQSERHDMRFTYLEKLLSKEQNNLVKLSFPENSLKILLKNIYILDWVALWLAGHKNINSVKIPNIKDLKRYLAGRGN